MQAEARDLLDKRSKDADEAAVTAEIAIGGGVPLCVVLLLIAGFLLTRNISAPLRHISAAARQIADGRPGRAGENRRPNATRWACWRGSSGK